VQSSLISNTVAATFVSCGFFVAFEQAPQLGIGYLPYYNLAPAEQPTKLIIQNGYHKNKVRL